MNHDLAVGPTARVGLAARGMGSENRILLSVDYLES